MNDDEFNNENEVAWIVDSRILDAKCSLNTDEGACEGEVGKYIISSNTGEIYDNHERQLKCAWIPKIIPLDEGGSTISGFTRSNGKCKFIHRAILMILNQFVDLCIVVKNIYHIQIEHVMENATTWPRNWFCH